jgi:hypothetical protein
MWGSTRCSHRGSQSQPFPLRPVFRPLIYLIGVKLCTVLETVKTTQLYHSESSGCWRAEHRWAWGDTPPA